SPRRSISASRQLPGTGTSSTWCGCSCSSRSMSGRPVRATDAKARPMRSRLLKTALVLSAAAPVAADFAFGLASDAPAAQGRAASVGTVLVEKAERRLQLLDADGAVLKSYTISLGGDPLGHKQREGDGRTPEGRYTIDWRNPQSA